MDEIANKNIDKTFRLSFATISTQNEGAEKRFNYSAAVSLSKMEVMSLGDAKNDTEITAIKLTCFWKRIGKNQFRLPDGGVIKSTSTLLEYFIAAVPHFTSELEELSRKHIYTVCFKESVVVPDAKKAGDVALDLKLHTFENKPTEFGKIPDAPGIDPNAIASAGPTPGRRPGQMTVDNWNEVVVVNNLLNGFCVDQTGQTITKARKTAFKLEPNPLHPLMFSPGTLRSTEIGNLRNRAKAASNVSPVKKVEMSLKSALESPRNSDAEDQDEINPSPSQPLDHLYPLWEVCDDSKIKIETIASTIQLVSAQQGFSNTSVEAAVATSVLSITAGGSAGFATNSSTSRSAETGEKSEQMHATYEFPRVRLYLDEDSVTLSGDCADAIANITSTKSYQALKDFYCNYGHLFVTRVKLGGRLRATRFLSASEAKSMYSTQNAWKASIASSFSSGTTSGEVKASTESASQNDQTSASTALHESICWEAHGGNTTLANNPSAWCNTVENFWFWRIVDQEVVLPIEEVISKLKGFESIRSIFAGITIDAMSQATATEICWNGADGATLGRGISATDEIEKPTDILRDSPLKAGTVDTVPVPAQHDSQWTVINSNSALYQFLTDIFGQTINQYVGTQVFPNLIWRLALNDRAFSVVLRIQTGLKKSTTTFTIADDSQPSDKQEWKQKYGDYFINSVISGTVATIVWIFTPQTTGVEQSQTRSALASFFAGPLTSFEIGCAYMARLAVSIPCEVYMYDAYFNETKVSSPSNVLLAISQRNYGPEQVTSVGLKPYRDLDFLQSAAELTTSSSVSGVGLAAVRKDHVEYAYQSIKRREGISPIETSVDSVKNWSTDFSQLAYSEGLKDPSGSHAGATYLAADYSNLYGRKSPPTKPRMDDWNGTYGDEAGYERILRWIRLSRQAEGSLLLSQSLNPTSTIFGLKDEPAMTDAEKVPGRSYGEPVIFSLRDQLKTADLEAIMAMNESLDGMWSYVLDDTNIGKMKFQKPGRVLAYELKATNWDGHGRPPAIASNGKLESKVGLELKEFARSRNDTKTTDWMLIDLWIVFAPFQVNAIVS
ncbi:MAG: hypothetical protein Q9213_003773 [Squamulea squamosa]